ncbi:hypothetical protein Emin_0467 [Elusimicrobium minutum Pei191]|uniref:DUF4097 domain-containing protein n=1 Tax=Elusimicrobium minutum (strain Pei191) TaxID=445932 RepID=B2KBK2_ELUMP|nr:DUF4097 family beta strand repeat-containing protein [Elusimicrobium minutum]ACC98024.1 hypothetical protein Emin_0467 [Elusimicrobium minutum Pei191]
MNKYFIYTAIFLTVFCIQAKSENVDNIVTKGGKTFISSYYDTEVFKSIEIKGTSIDVEILPAESYKIHTKVMDKRNIDWTLADGKLVITQLPQYHMDCKSKMRATHRKCINDEIKIFVPTSFTCQQITSTLTSGDIEIKGIACKEFYAKTESGDIDLERFSAVRGDIFSINGEISIEDSSFDMLKAFLSSGDIKVERSVLNDVDINTISGGIKIKGEVKGIAKIETKTGNIELRTSLKESEYNKIITAKKGEITVNSFALKSYNESKKPDVANELNILSANGNIKLRFAE